MNSSFHARVCARALKFYARTLGLFVLACFLFSAASAQNLSDQVFTVTSSTDTHGATGQFTINTCTRCTFNISGGATLTLNQTFGSCTQCTVNITGNSTLLTQIPMNFINSTINVTSFKFDVEGTLALNNTTINIAAGSQLFVNAATTLTGSTINVAGGSPAVPGLFVDAKLQFLDNASSIRLTTPASYIGTPSNPNLIVNPAGNPIPGGQTSYSGSTTGRISATGTSVTLPILLSGFTASSDDGQHIHLAWTTTAESNPAYFVLQRSADGAGWEEIGRVPAATQSSTPQEYGYTDGAPLHELNYYRLKMADLDGRSAYSMVRVVRLSRSTAIQVFPNPATGYVNISTGNLTGVTLRLFSPSGSLLLEKKTGAPGNGAVITIPLQDYAAGLYILQVTATGGYHQNLPLQILKH
jgi:hypothetical protein